MMSDSLPKLQLFPCSLSSILQKNQCNKKPAKVTPKPLCNKDKKKNKTKQQTSYIMPVLHQLYAQELTSPILSCRRYPVFKLNNFHEDKTLKQRQVFPFHSPVSKKKRKVTWKVMISAMVFLHLFSLLNS